MAALALAVQRGNVCAVGVGRVTVVSFICPYQENKKLRQDYTRRHLFKFYWPEDWDMSSCPLLVFLLPPHQLWIKKKKKGRENEYLAMLTLKVEVGREQSGW